MNNWIFKAITQNTLKDWYHMVQPKPFELKHNCNSLLTSTSNTHRTVVCDPHVTVRIRAVIQDEPLDQREGLGVSPELTHTHFSLLLRTRLPALGFEDCGRLKWAEAALTNCLPAVCLMGFPHTVCQYFLCC